MGARQKNESGWIPCGLIAGLLCKWQVTGIWENNSILNVVCLQLFLLCPEMNWWSSCLLQQVKQQSFITSSVKRALLVGKCNLSTPSSLYLRPEIEREVLYVSVSIPKAAHMPCAALHCGIPLSDYCLPLSLSSLWAPPPHPHPCIPTQSMCFKQSGNGNIPPLICAHTHSHSFYAVAHGG